MAAVLVLVVLFGISAATVFSVVLFATRTPPGPPASEFDSIVAALLRSDPDFRQRVSPG